MKELYSTIAGSFVISKGRIIDKETSIKDKDKAIKRLLARNRGTRQAEGVLDDFKELYGYFYSANLAETRSRIRDAITDDALVVMLFNSIDTIAFAINELSKKLRLWSGFYVPVAARKIEDNKKLAFLLATKTRHEIIKSFNVKEKDCMGTDIKTKQEMLMLAKEILSLFELKEKQTKKLKLVVKQCCPNTAEVLGVMLCANMLKHAGSLKKLMAMPASTIQLLGAEKALFRHMKTGAKSPKHGIIKAHPLISKNPLKMHGKIARNIADKASLAAKVDYFKGKFIGDKLKKSLIKKFGEF